MFTEIRGFEEVMKIAVEEVVQKDPKIFHPEQKDGTKECRNAKSMKADERCHSILQSDPVARDSDQQDVVASDRAIADPVDVMTRKGTVDLVELGETQDPKHSAA